MIKLKQLFNKHFVYKGYVVIHNSDGTDDVIGFTGIRDLWHVKRRYLHSSDDYTVYFDSQSDMLFLFILFFISYSLGLIINEFI